MNDLQVFTNPQFGEIRSILLDGNPWFVLKDVCAAFGEQNYRRVSDRLDFDEKGVSQIDTPGEVQNMTVVSECGVYSALFAMQPTKARGVTDDFIEYRKKKLTDFKRWVTHEVLPSIRKTGSYQRPMTAAEQLLAQANVLVELERRVENQDEQIRETRQRVTDAVAVFSAAAAAVDTWQEDTNRKINEIVESCGYSHQAYRGELYKKLEERAGVDITTRQTRLRNRMKLAGATHKERDAVTKLHVIARDKKLRPIFDGILREERAKRICAAWSH